MSETNYLRLKYISLMSTRWFQDFNSNLARLDLLGKAIRIQQGAGQKSALRVELSDGSLAEYLKAVPNGPGVDLYLGRANTSDRVIIQSPTGGIGTREEVILATVTGTPAPEVKTYTGLLALGEGTWDLTVNADFDLIIDSPSLTGRVETYFGVFPASSANQISSTTAYYFNVSATMRDRRCINLVVPNLPGNLEYRIGWWYRVPASIGTGSVTIGIQRDVGNATISATRVA